MELAIKNYCAIKEGTIDLSKKLYLFVGYNNTGKTCLTKLIYEIFNSNTLNDFSNSNYNNFEYKKSKKLRLTEKLIDEILKNYSNYLKEVVVKKSLKIDIDDSFLIEFKYSIADVKNNGLESGVKIGVAGIDTEVEIYNLNKNKNSMEITFNHWSKKEISSKLPSDFFDNVPKKKFEEQINSVKSNVSKDLVNSLLNLLLQNQEQPFFLPSNRVCILENAEELKRKEEARKKELSELLIDILESKSKKPSMSDILAKKSESEYPSYINSLLDKIIKLRSSKEDDFLIKGTGFYDDLLSEFHQILGGEIVYKKTASVSTYVEKLKMKNGEHIKMDLASSSVNQLSTLFLFLKYWAKPEGNFLMIDEPEENLHPENQILLLNLLLAFISNKNNRLLITTHSPLVAEIINNYLVLSQLENKDEMKEIGLPAIDIASDSTGIYFFQGEYIAEHKIENYGTLFTSFKLAQDKVYSLGGNLSDLMFEQMNRQ